MKAGPAFRDRHNGHSAGPDGFREEGTFTIELEGRTYSVPQCCPHRAGRLRHGHVNVKHKTITCPLHQSRFSLETGEQLGGPPCGRLGVVEVTGKQVRAQLPEYRAEQVWLPFSEALLDWDDAFHDLMLGDRIRMEAYRKAIFEAVEPGMRVIDLGTGTGILSLWALEAGAAHVYGIDLRDDVLEQAVARMRAAGFADRFEPVNRISYDVELPHRMDVLISEIMGNLADNEDFQPILEDACRRFLKRGGTAVPSAVSSYLVPVAARGAHRDLARGEIAALNASYDIGALLRRRGIRSPFNLYYDVILPRHLHLSEARPLRAYSGDWRQTSTYERELTFTIRRAGTFTGFKGYFIARLTPRTTLDISGDDITARETSDSWKHAYLPIARPLGVRAGDRLQLRLSRSYPEGRAPFRQIYRWRGEVLRGTRVVGVFDQCTDESQLGRNGHW